MATAGRPLAAMPVSARSTRKPCQLGISTAPMVSSAEAKSEAAITRLRPQTSESGLTISSETASVAQGSYSVRLLSAGETAKVSWKTGSSGWTP